MNSNPPSGVSTPSRILAALRELVSALDRRVPQAERPGETGIAREAQMLRREAVAQIETLSRRRSDDKPYDRELVEAIMTDDGCPTPRSETNAESSCGVWKRTELPRTATAADMPATP